MLDNDFYSLSKQFDRAYDSETSEENSYGSISFTREYSSPIKTIPETSIYSRSPSLNTRNVSRYDGSEEEQRLNITREVPIHDTGYLSIRETPKQVSFADERFPLLSFLKTKNARIQTNNDTQVSVSRQVNGTLSQTGMPPELYGNQGTNANQSVIVAQESKLSVNSHHVATPIFTTTPAVISETSSSINNIRRGIDNVHVTISCKDYLPQSQIYNTPKLKENQIQFSKFSQIPHNLFKIELNLHVTIMAKGR
jgi:hypothetical protein